MPDPIDPDDHPLLPEDDESELRYEERTTEDESDETTAEEQDHSAHPGTRRIAN